MRSNPPWFDAESKAVPVGRWLFSIGQTTPHQSRLPAYQELLMWLTFMCLAWRANEWFMVWLSRDATTPE